MAAKTQYWLMKSEPSAFSIDDLAASPDQTTCWDGVRNYQARNYMREMRRGDRVLYYHSGADPAPAVVGTAQVVREAYPDHTALDPKSKYYAPKATPENPIWEMVDIRLDKIFATPQPLAELRELPQLSKMVLLQKGSRLSVQPVTKSEFDTIVKRGRRPTKS